MSEQLRQNFKNGPPARTQPLPPPDLDLHAQPHRVRDLPRPVRRGLRGHPQHSGTRNPPRHAHRTKSGAGPPATPNAQSRRSRRRAANPAAPGQELLCSATRLKDAQVEELQAAWLGLGFLDEKASPCKVK